jgi:hypothetical protein
MKSFRTLDLSVAFYQESEKKLTKVDRTFTGPITEGSLVYFVKLKRR